MRNSLLAIGVLASLGLSASGARAQERPDEDTLFGAPQSPGTKAETEPGTNPETKPATPDTNRETSPSAPVLLPNELRPNEDKLFGATDVKTELSSEAAPANPLTIGGLIYMRLLASSYEGTPAGLFRLSAPTLADIYFDARPNDRVRGSIIGRLQYNPLAIDNQYASLLGASTTDSGTGTTSSSATAPTFVLNQLWLRFDISRRVFVTAGKQFVKWGTSHFWNPTDFLQPVRRNPLEPFDVRTGVPMVKLHLPWESKGWNLYAIGLLDNYQEPGTLNYTSAFTANRVSGAVRGEAVFGTVEVGLDTLVQQGHRPKLGADISAGVGPIDVYAEAALRQGSDVVYLNKTTTQATNPYTGEPTAIDTFESVYKPGALWPSVSGGANWSTTVHGNATLNVGAEYFYNSAGYTDTSYYVPLLRAGMYQPFYVGRHYGSIFASLIGPSAWNYSSFTFSTLANITDGSFLSRLDYSVKALTFLSVEAFAAVHYGSDEGEFRFSIPLPQSITFEGQTVNAIPPQLLDFGVSLRMNI